MRFGGAHKAIFDATVSGSPDATYLAAWLTNPNVNWPYKETGGVSATANFSARDVDLAIVGHHKVTAATVTGFGALTTSVLRPDNIYRNYGKLLSTPINISSAPLTTTGDIVGVLWVGLTSVFPGLLHGRKLSPEKPFSWEGEFRSLAPFSKGVAAQRRASGRVILTDLEFAELDAVFESQDKGSYPIAWCEHDDDTDPWMCQFNYDATYNEGYHFVDLEITEIPRLRWPA